MSVAVVIVGPAQMQSEEKPRNAESVKMRWSHRRQCLVGLNVTVAEYGTAEKQWKDQHKSARNVDKTLNHQTLKK